LHVLARHFSRENQDLQWPLWLHKQKQLQVIILTVQVTGSHVDFLVTWFSIDLRILVGHAYREVIAWLVCNDALQ
jgi:hypothetical protein